MHFLRLTETLQIEIIKVRTLTTAEKSKINGRVPGVEIDKKAVSQNNVEKGASDDEAEEHLSTPISEMGITRDVARLASLGLTHAVAWLNVIPSPTLCLQLLPSEFVSVKYRLLFVPTSQFISFRK